MYGGSLIKGLSYVFWLRLLRKIWIDNLESPMFKIIKIKTFRSFMIMGEFPKLQTRLFISALGFVQCHILYGVVQKVTMCVH